MKEIILDESVTDIDKWLPKEAIDETPGEMSLRCSLG